MEITDKERMDYLDTQVEHISAAQGAPDCTRVSILLNGGKFTAREVIDLCMSGQAEEV